MERALITTATVGILASAGCMIEANAQQMSPGPAPSQAYAPSQMSPTQAYAQRRARRSARRAPDAAGPGGTAYTPGSGPPLRASRGNGMALPARTGAATCASRTPTRCAVMASKGRARRRNERRSLLALSPAFLAGLFFCPNSESPN